MNANLSYCHAICRRAVEAIVVAVTLLTAGVACALELETPQTYAAKTHPAHVAVGDFNNDGWPDFAVCNWYWWLRGGNVSVYFNNGDGTFQPQLVLPTGVGPRWIAAGDVNDDNIPDLATGNESGSVSVLISNGDGTFQADRRIPSPRPIGVVIADFDGDGHGDVAAANHSASTVQTFLGDGTGAFTEKMPRSPACRPHGLTGGDLNADGIPDLVTANWHCGNLSVLIGNGDGTFVETSRPGVGPRCGSAAIGDVNSDNIADLVAFTTIDHSMSVLIGHGDGTFEPQLKESIGHSPYSTTLADVDGDGRLDALGISTHGGNYNAIVIFLPGQGDGTFGDMLTVSTDGDFGWNMAAADLNGDDVLDLITANAISLDVSVLLQVPPNLPPECDAGDNVQIVSAAQWLAVIQGTAGDPDDDPLLYRWLEGATVLLDWTAVGAGGEAPLDLGALGYLALGPHTLTLEVSDGKLTASDEMILTLDNSPPEVEASPLHQVIQIGVDPVVVVADAADFDGDTLSFEWLLDAASAGSGVVTPPQDGEPVPVPELTLSAGDPRCGLGVHAVEMQVDDNVNPPVSDYVTFTVHDTIAPSLGPIPSTTILWPPNHKLVPVTIQANAFDNGGGPITLDVTVESSEPPDSDGDGNTIPDWVVDTVDDATGIIELRLRAERSGKGDGRVYTILITATDASGNAAQALVEIRAPHDKGKKK